MKVSFRIKGIRKEHKSISAASLAFCSWLNECLPNFSVKVSGGGISGELSHAAVARGFGIDTKGVELK